MADHPQIALEPVEAPSPRRKLQKWDGRRPAGLMPRPEPGVGPEGEAVAATLISSIPSNVAMMGQHGWSVAEAGTGEITNEGAFTVEDGKIIYGDMVVVVRDAEFDRLAREADAADMRHASTAEANTDVGVLVPDADD